MKVEVKIIDNKKDKTFLMHTHVGEATDDKGCKYELGTLGWNGVGIVIEDLENNVYYLVETKTLLEEILKQKYEVNTYATKK